MRNKLFLILGALLLIFILYISSLFGPRVEEVGVRPPYTTTTDDELVDDGVSSVVKEATSLKTPQLLSVYRGRLVIDPHLYDFVDGDSALVLLFLNPRTRLLEMNDGDTALNLISDRLNTVNEISWSRRDRAIASTGNLTSEKRDYFLNFANWSSTEPPASIPLPFSGSNYFWSNDGRSVAYFGNIDSRTGTAEIFTYNFTTRNADTAAGVKIIGPKELLWLADGRFIATEVNEGAIETTDLFLVEGQEDGNWGKTLVSEKVGGPAYLNPVGDKVLLIEEGDFVVYDFSGRGVERNAVGQVISDDFVYDFSDNDKFSVVYREDGKYYLAKVDSDSGSAEKAELSFVRETSSVLQTLEKDSTGRYVLVFTSGATYAFE